MTTKVKNVYNRNYFLFLLMRSDLWKYGLSEFIDSEINRIEISLQNDTIDVIQRKAIHRQALIDIKRNLESSAMLYFNGLTNDEKCDIIKEVKNIINTILKSVGCNTVNNSK